MIDIYFEKIRVGAIDIQNDRPRFTYDKDWTVRRAAFPLSLSMPLSSTPIPAEKILPWLANLLPESHLSEIGQQIGVSPQDIVGLLEHIGRDTAGALSIGAPREDSDKFRVIKRETDVERIINELPQKPFLIGEDGVSMSLAGVQDKLPVALSNGKIAIPLNGTPSTHILKPDIYRLSGSVQNEAFCLMLAKLTGLEAATAITGRAGKRQYLLVERYDRLVTPRGIQRIHQEDFCQLLGYFPSMKYESASTAGESGPGLTDIFSAAATKISPGTRLALLDGLIFNVLICNTDAHAKNYSILIGAGGYAKLAPFYDLMCGEVYPGITKMLPQKINGRREAIHIQGSDWREFAKSVSLSPARTIKRVREICDRVAANIDVAHAAVRNMPAGGNTILDQVAFQVRKRCKRISSQLDDVGTKRKSRS